MADLIFDTPWWLPTVIIAAGVALWISGNKRTDRMLRSLGLGVAALGVLLFVVSYTVDTKVEKVTRKSRDLVQSAVDRDYARMGSLLDAKCLFRIPNERADDLAVSGSRDEIIKAAQIALPGSGLRNANTSSIEVKDQGALLTVTISLTTFHDNQTGAVTSEWQFDFEDTGTAEGWVVTEIRPLKVDKYRGSDIRGLFPLLGR